RLAHDETGFGNVPDKTRKNLFVIVDVHRFIRPMRTVGVLSEDPEKRLIEIAAPAGIVAAIVPTTNPTSTAINKIFIALKAACPIVISPHPNARACVQEVARVLDRAAREAGAPPGSIACMTHVSIEGTRELMKHRLTGIILATGGTGLVRAAYSSGKPAFGVGPGNVPAFVDRSADIAKAARDIVAGKTFDNGVLCSAENAVVADAPIDGALVEAMKAEGAAFLDAAEIAALERVVVTPAGALNTAIVGRDASTIAAMAGLRVAGGTRCLIARLDRVGAEAPLSREKLSPILAYYVEDGWEAACARCLEILAYGGMGHTMSIHARDRDVIMRFALGKPVFRIVVNSPAAVGAVGVTTGVDPSMTLGCGALGGNITSDNITPRHLVNVKRLAFELRSFAAEAPPGPPARPPGIVPGFPRSATGTAPVPAPSSAPASPKGLPDPASLRALILAAADRRGVVAPGRPADPPEREGPRARAVRPDAPGGAPTGTRATPGPVPFVSEADVRAALLEGRRIAISSKTIVTPSARDLGDAHRVFVES
ncbi:MAG: aldehyde dehydrogenase family protein, partial [Acidobacteria bacterium]|nr:aldehyde dehydrogenase family protein [Acidobacteriota bacterium]